MDLGERKTSSSTSEPLSNARTKLADVFSILKEGEAMATRYLDLMFTDAVCRAQTQYYGSAGKIAVAPERDPLGRTEVEFIAARDSFYLGTVSESGWPYIQHRGGPAGFLRVINETTLVFADYKGNRRYMLPRRTGRIINIGSVTSVFGYAGLGPYGASRGGIRQLTMSLADDWGPHGITVNCLAPGWFQTEQNKVLYEDAEWVDYLIDRIPLKRPGRPEDLEGAVVSSHRMRAPM